MCGEVRSSSEDRVSSKVLAVIEHHRQTFEALQRQVQRSGDSDDDGSVAEHLELARLEDDVEQAALAMTVVPLLSIEDVITLLAYIDEFSHGKRSGYLLWPEAGSIEAEELPWSFAVLRNVRRSLEFIRLVTCSQKLS